jgi:hypothetical protein
LTIDRIVSSRTSEGIQRLDGRFTAQETALAALERQLRDNQTAMQTMSLDSPDGLGDGSGESWSAAERDSAVQLSARLREVCQETLSATEAVRIEQEFGDMETDDSARAFQGIAGTAQSGVRQSFGKMTTTKGSTAAQGQMDAASFAMMFKRE